MAIYTTFFVCEPSALSKVFPTWKAPLAKPVARTWRHPLTGKMVTTLSDAPDWPNEEDEPGSPPAVSVVTVPGEDYAKYLEARLSPAVRALPHWCAKGLTETELEPLGDFLKITPTLETALYAPPTSDELLFRFNARIQSALATLDENKRRAAAAHWAAVMSDDEHTLLGSGMRLPGVAIDGASAYLTELCKLAKRAGTKETLYLLVGA